MKSKKIAAFGTLVILALSLIGLALAGCATSAKGGAASQAGATLWAQNCGHCHNIRSPNNYSDAQWDVILLHMRVRANLTAGEHQQILAFLKSAH